MVTFAPILDKTDNIRNGLPWNGKYRPQGKPLKPSNPPFSSWMVIISKRAWGGMGMGAVPGIDNRTFLPIFATWQAAPEDECRITMISGFMDSRVLTVSLNVSPLTMLEEDLDMATVSAGKTLSGQLKGQLGPGWRLLEEKHNGFYPEGWALFLTAPLGDLFSSPGLWSRI